MRNRCGWTGRLPAALPALAGCLPAAVLAGVLGTGPSGARGQTATAAGAEARASRTRPVTAEAALPRHILKRFDFDERKFGNVEDTPMYWTRRKGPNLPHYNRGIFDMTVGHGAAPCFRLEVVTESAAYTYSRPDILVEPGARYLVSGWIRTRRLVHSGAYLSAAYLTRDLRILADTEVFSPAVGNAQGDGDSWRRIEVPTAECPQVARFLQISVWLAQPDLGREPPSRFRPIAQHDTYATAWFDDIEVTHLLPAASLRMKDDNPIVEADEPVELLGPAVNPAHFGLTGRITVTDDEGRVYLRTQTDPSRPRDWPPEVFRLDGLPSGPYVATLDVLSQDRRIMRHEAGFVKLPRLPASTNRQIGICLDEASLCAVPAAIACIQGLGPGHLKIPIWTARTPSTEVDQRSGVVDDLLKQILPGGVEPVGVLAEPPEGVADRFPPTRRTLVDILCADPQVWQPLLTISLTHYADVMRLWQIGADDQTNLALDPRYPTAAGLAAEQVAMLIGGAEVALTWPATMTVTAAPPHVGRTSIVIPDAILPAQIPQYAAEHAQAGTPTWLYLAPPEGGPYLPGARRADLAKRIVYALAGRAQTVFLPQPWTTYTAGDRSFLAPTEEYCAAATLSRALADTSYSGFFSWMGGAVFHIFVGPTNATLVGWNDRVADDRDPAAQVTLSLGAGAAAYDLRGRPLALAGREEQTLTVTREPIVIIGADSRLAQLRSHFDIVPRQIASGLRRHQHQVRLHNPSGEPISGTIRLRGPEGWEIMPTRLGFSLPPGQTMTETVEIQIPYNEATGPKIIHADLTLESRRIQQVTLPFALDLQLPGIDTYAFADSAGPDVIVQHVLTNRTKEELSFVGSLLLPSAARQERLFLHVQPGQTVIKEYVVSRSSLDGQSRVRLNLREINGPRLLNQVVEIF